MEINWRILWEGGGFVVKLGELSRNSSGGIEENHLRRHLTLILLMWRIG